ncbi:MAG: hypothetical protein OEL56_07525 [Nitrosopumilus sp.]|nr:hypothetical protein [Nitrosopumilus sp.]MDH5417356.1 hypothetical protein [Nitrosopumilus sp.]
MRRRLNEINEHGEVLEKHLLDSSAEEFDISQITAKRYLDAMCSSHGCLEKVSRVKSSIIRMKKEDLWHNLFLHHYEFEQF